MLSVLEDGIATMAIALTEVTSRAINALLSFLLKPRLPLWRYCLVIFPLALLPSVGLLALADGLLQAVSVDLTPLESRLSKPSDFGELIASVVFAPVVETFILAIVLTWLQRATSNIVRVAVISAVLWGAVHGISGLLAYGTPGLLWSLGTVWNFFVFSCGFIGWRAHSFWQAYAAAAVPHVLINATSEIMMAVERSV
jgi:hypothetical protein